MHRRQERGRSSGVEHNLAKVGVEGSNPFARSKISITYISKICFPALRHDAGEAWGKQTRAHFGASTRIQMIVSPRSQAFGMRIVDRIGLAIGREQANRIALA